MSRGPGAGGGGGGPSRNTANISALTSYGIPHDSEGFDGDITAAITQNGIVLYYKFDGIWYYLSHLKRPTADGQSVEIGRNRDATFKELYAENMNSDFIIKYPIYFNDTTTGRTYFRDTDDPNDIMSWDGFDADDDTTIGNTIAINLSNAVAGIVVPYDCIYKGYYLNLYQSINTSGNIRFQTWTGKVPHNTASGTTTITLRTTSNLTSSRVSIAGKQPAKVKMTAGESLYPAIQYVSGSSPIWFGSATFIFEKDIKNIKVKNK